MKLTPILAMLGALPLPLAAISSADLKAPTKPLSPVDCGCSLEGESTSSAQLQPRSGPPQPPLPPCPPHWTGCTITNTYTDWWCASGGIFQTCETTGDNDGDGIWGENHFWQKRDVIYRNCNGTNYIECKKFVGATVPGQPGQDMCCSNTFSEPLCPVGSCR